jgi:hypothetical protein
MKFTRSGGQLVRRRESRSRKRTATVRAEPPNFRAQIPNSQVPAGQWVGRTCCVEGWDGSHSHWHTAVTRGGRRVSQRGDRWDRRAEWAIRWIQANCAASSLVTSHQTRYRSAQVADRRHAGPPAADAAAGKSAFAGTLPLPARLGGNALRHPSHSTKRPG